MAILENFLAGFAANVASNLIQAAGSKIETKLQQPEVQKAVERCVKDASTALLTRVQEPTPEKQHQLLDCFQDAFKYRSIAREFNKIFREKGPDVEELVYLFEEEADWNLQDLPWIDFKDGMQTFITAFLESALREPRLNEIIRAEHLIQQTKLQRELLEEVRRIVAFLRDEGLRVVGINADQIQAHNVANEIVIHQIYQTDTQGKRAGAEEQHYLKTLIGDCDALDLAAIDEMCAADDKIETSEVFTTLNLTGPGRLPEESVEEAIRHGSAARRDVEKGKEPVPIQAVEAIGSMARLVILGQPGGGKSTLVNYVAAQLALRRADPDGPLPPLPGWSVDPRPIPVRIILRRLAVDMPDETEQDGAGVVWDHLKKQLDKSGCEGFYEALRHILQDEGGVIFFDGLDEVMQTDDDPKRSRLRNAMLAFSKPLEDKCKIIVTSREYAYNKSDEWRLPSDRFPVVTLDAFNNEQIKTFVETWYTVIGPRKGLDEAVTQKQADHLIGAIQSLPHLKELAQYPLLLTLMAQVHGTIGHLPENRADLYKRAINLLLAHWDNRLVREAGGACKVEKGLIMRLGVRLETLRASLERLAFTAHEKQEKESNRTEGCADIPMMDLLTELRKDLKSLGAVETVIEYIHERAGLLHALEEYKVYAFPHRTFQEYLTAVHIMKKSDFHTLLRDRVRRDLVWWREVFLLGAGIYREGPLYVSHLLTALLPNGPSELEKKNISNEKSQHAQLCARALIETDFSGHVEKEREVEPGFYTETFKRIQEWLVSSMGSVETLAAKERAASGRILSQLGDPRAEATTLENMEFCLVPDSPFQMGDGKERHPSDHLSYDYWMAEHPVTNAQYARFVDAGGYEEARYWAEAEAAGCWISGKFKGKYEDEFSKGPRRYSIPLNLENHPAVGVSWYEALAFTRWLTDFWRDNGIIDKNWRIRLPSEAEWEKAARGGLKIPGPVIISAAAEKAWERKANIIVDNEASERVYPWGDDIDKEKANYDDTGIGTTSALGCFSSGASPYGCLDMAGNVWEWTRSLDKKYPYDPNDGRENEDDNGARVLRGGAFNDSADYVRCARRGRHSPYYRLTGRGFRCVCAPNTSVL